ncbi:MAG: hypothetical protein JSV69_07385 [Chloroflexota bacterium]|nr:MAG: hypothetical protein JSV69_07385 [Chloroflexota bacterium]
MMSNFIRARILAFDSFGQKSPAWQSAVSLLRSKGKGEACFWYQIQQKSVFIAQADVLSGEACAERSL